MSKGWKYESGRHALSARGVKTNPDEHNTKRPTGSGTYAFEHSYDASCLERVDHEFKERMEDLHKLWKAYNEDPDSEVPDLGSIYDYGLSFDYVPAGTFTDQEYGYFRYQFSWGGPSDEVRYYVDADMKPYKIEYWFMDWYDGAKKIPRGKDKELLMEIFAWFDDSGTTKQKMEEAEG